MLLKRCLINLKKLWKVQIRKLNVAKEAGVPDLKRLILRSLNIILKEKNSISGF